MAAISEKYVYGVFFSFNDQNDDDKAVSNCFYEALVNAGVRHYTSLLDLFSRSGHLDEAENRLITMPFRPNEAALLSACECHGIAK
ncbi:hypothetical protein LguiB_006225 [Lonicera macranthoides]